MKFKPEIFLVSVGFTYLLWLAFTVMTNSNEAYTAFDRFGIAFVGMLLGWPVTLIALFLIYCGVYVYVDKKDGKNKDS